jgi:membrane-associated phospholipid phosphatase
LDLNTGIAFISLMQSQSWALPIMRIASALGTLEFLLVFLPAVCWCWDFKLGFRMVLVMAIGHGLGESLKVAFHTPRPYWISHDVKALTSYPSFSFPSSHALDATCAWGMLASSFRRPLAWAAACALIFLIGISRAYLGVHFPWDVAAGWLTGAIILAAFLKAEPTVSGWFWGRGIKTQILISFFSSLTILILYALCRASLNGWQVPTAWYEDALAASGSAIAPFSPAEALITSGIIFGAASGYSLLFRRRAFSGRRPDDQESREVCAGNDRTCHHLVRTRIDGIITLKPKSIVAYAAIYIRSALAGSWFTLGAPELFVRTGLAEDTRGR